MRDRLLLSAVFLLSCAPSVADLGFYSDDWAALGWFSTVEEPTLAALCRSIASPIIVMRPVQILNMALAWRAFGAEPLGYHLVNAGVLLAAVLLFQEALLRLGTGRFLALAVPMVYGLLPHFTTARVWILSPSIAFSLATYFGSLVADLRAAEARGAARWGWKLLSLVALLASVLAYEAAMPLFALNALLVWRQGGRTRSALGLALLTLAPLAPLAAFKAASTIRLPQGDRWENARLLLAAAVRPGYGRRAYGFNLWAALRVSFGTYGVLLPRTAARLAGSAGEVAWAVAAGGLAWAGLRSAARDGIPGRSAFAAATISGLAVFALGWAIFLTNWNVQITPTGLANRTAAAAAIGVALALVGTAGWAASFLPSPRVRREVLCAVLAVLGASGALSVTGILRWWEEAWPREREILAGLGRAVPALPPGSVVLLDGACPYHGPAIVFESDWDLRGALMLARGDRTLRADVLAPSSRLREDGVACTLYGTEHVYPFGNLWVYDHRTGTAVRLPDAEAARRWWEQRRPPDCPPGVEGRGVEIL